MTSGIAPTPREVHARVFPSAVPDSVCQSLIDEFTAAHFEEATIVNQNGRRVDPEVRRVEVRGVEADHWSSGLITRFAELANQQVWNLDYTQLEAPFSLLRYEDASHFDWHVDVEGSGTHPGAEDAATSERKLSVTVNLSDPADYDGGIVEFADAHGALMSFPELAERGSVVVFPSTTLHRVTPLTRGVRWAMVGWLLGPRLR